MTPGDCMIIKLVFIYFDINGKKANASAHPHSSFKFLWRGHKVFIE